MHGDWIEIQQRDTLVVLMENSASTYYKFGEEEMGFDFELIKEFAKDYQLHLRIKIVDDVDSMFHMIDVQKADIICSNLTYTAQRDSFADFSLPIYATRQVLVQRAFDKHRTKQKFPLIKDTTELTNVMISVHGYSVFYQRIKELERNMNAALSVHVVPGSYSSDDLVRLVSEGKLAATITDESLMGILIEDYPNLDYQFEISSPQPICWAFRNHSPKMKDVVDQWLSKETTKIKINQLRKKYFKSNTTSIVHTHTSLELPKIRGGVISPFDNDFKSAAKEVGWDWKLLAALAYQESRFDSNAVSRHGAFGVMQLMPSSAKRFGCDSLDFVKGNIRAAARLLLELDRNFQRRVKNKEERIKFVLAAYNSGLGHVQDAMQIARKLNQPDSIWYQNVENTLLLKSQKEYYTLEGVNNGYCRCHETYHFVYRVLGYYNHFKKVNVQ
jgi:membrane-bound lytic murein transglycosylase F